MDINTLQSATIDGLQLFYHLSNSKIDSNKPTVLLGHSYLWDHQMWREQLEVLQSHYNCIATDLPAHGQTGIWQDRNYSIQRLSDLHYELMQQLGIEKFTVIGLSVGGMWGTQLALDHPKMVQGLCIMGSYVGVEPVETRTQYLSLLDITATHGFSEEMLSNLVNYFLTMTTAKTREDLVERFKQPLRYLNQDAERRAHVCELGRYIFNRDSLMEKLSSLTVPVHIIVGQQDLPRPVCESEQMAKQIAECELTIIENAAHISNIEQVEIVTATLERFLKKIY